MGRADISRAFAAGEHPRAPSGPGGGEFVPASSGNKSQPKGHTPTHPVGHGRPAGHHHAAAKPAGKLTSSLSYDPKANRGPGYDRANGDAHVHELQRALNRLGLGDSAGRALKDDGKFGPRTTSAVKRAQQRLGLKPDGVLTPALYERLLAMKAMPAAHRSAGRTGSGSISRDVTMAGPQDAMMPDAAAAMGADMQMHRQLCDLLAGLSDDEIRELAALAEAMQADGGM